MENDNENCFLLISLTSINVCRICAQTLTNLKSIYDFNSYINPLIKIEDMLNYLEVINIFFTKKNKKKVKYYFKLQVPIEDYPKEICTVCEYDLCASFLFKLKLHNSKIIFESQAAINSSNMIPTNTQLNDPINILNNETENETDIVMLNFEISKMNTPEIFDSLKNYRKMLRKNDSVNKNSYKCFICKSTFVTQVNFLSHFRIHTYPCRYKCLTCGLKFDKVVLAQNHGRAHKNVIISCRKCNKKSKDVFEITNHRCHRRRNTYICSICKITFAKKECFDNHKLQEHELNALCDKCGIKSSNFKYHICDE